MQLVHIRMCNGLKYTPALQDYYGEEEKERNKGREGWRKREQRRKEIKNISVIICALITY